VSDADIDHCVIAEWGMYNSPSISPKPTNPFEMAADPSHDRTRARTAHGALARGALAHGAPARAHAGARRAHSGYSSGCGALRLGSNAVTDSYPIMRWGRL
jgi:hypothetical protein